jgi:hypothetical protein
MKHAYMRETHCLMCVSVKSRLRWALRFLVRCVYATVLLIYIYTYIDAMHTLHMDVQKRH